MWTAVCAEAARRSNRALATVAWRNISVADETSTTRGEPSGTLDTRVAATALVRSAAQGYRLVTSAHSCYRNSRQSVPSRGRRREGQRTHPLHAPLTAQAVDARLVDAAAVGDVEATARGARAVGADVVRCACAREPREPRGTLRARHRSSKGCSGLDATLWGRTRAGESMRR